MTKILIIEDEPDMRSNLATILELEHYEAIVAADGRCGVALAKSQLPDLILCDIRMPFMDGYGVLEAVRGDSVTAKIPFIFLTAKGERPELRAGMDKGADDYLVKPVSIDELLGAISARLERQRQQAKFKVEFKSPKPLESLGLSTREAEILFWVAQGKTNLEIGLILDISSATVKKHLEHIFQKLAAENRATASLRALEALGADSAGS